MAKTKANTKVTARGTAVKGSRKGSAEPAAAMADNPAEPAPGRARGTKQALVLGLLQRKHGASLAELVAATSWLPHTTRAALTRPSAGRPRSPEGEAGYGRDGLPDRARPCGSRAQGRLINDGQ